MLKNTLRYLLKNNAPRWLVLLIDIYIVSNTFILAYLIRFNFHLNFDTSRFFTQLPIVIIGALVSFLLIGSYKGVIRRTGMRDAFNVTTASIVLVMLLGLTVFINRRTNFNDSLNIPLSIILIHFLLNVVVLIASRFVFKIVYDYLITDIKFKEHALIYGAGQAGLITQTILKTDKKSKIQVLGYIDDNQSKVGKKINGLNVYDPKSITEEFIASKEIDTIIIAIQTIKSERLVKIVDKLSALKLKVKIVPAVKDWIDNSLNSHQIKSVKIEDLLGRDQISLDSTLLKKEFNNKTVLITGAAGSIGSEITRQITHFNYKKIILIDQAESDLYNLQQELCQKNYHNIQAVVADIRDKNRLAKIFKKEQPHIVFHAAAYKHVPLMEDNPYEAIQVNVLGTKNVADLAIRYKVEKFVMVSTDKAVNPTNVMGATKRVAEMYINCLNQQGLTKFITTRFGNVLGSNGSVIPLFKKQIENGGPLTVTHKEITRYFMTIPEACLLVLEAGAMGNGGEIFVFDMGASMKIYNLALNMIRLSGLRFPEDIAIKITGLRPGEKLYEELLSDKELTLETYNEKIKIAKVPEVDCGLINDRLEILATLKNAEASELVAVLKEIVPEYLSNNSVFEALDKKDVSEVVIS
ncbi:MAG: polysaccharide biosynthesis protein [Flavobacteriaceae bacterium]|nr:polysaccharide biosynthesis protein [Flavobacteriaceae bacterium]